MEIFDNVNRSVRDDLSTVCVPGSRISIAAACFSIYAYQELKEQLEGIEQLRFIFTAQTFTAEKDFFIAAMEATPGISIRGSNANMILMDLAHHAPAAAAEALAAKGLVVADATSFRGLENHRALRVSLRGRADNERLVAAIKAIA